MEKLGIAGNLYRQYLSGKYCDLRIRVEDTSFRAHSCVVAAASWVLEAILQSSTAVSSNVSELTIELHGVTSYAISALLTYIYTGKLDPEVFVDDCKQRDVLQASKLYKLDDIATQLQSENAISMPKTDAIAEGNVDSNFNIPTMLETSGLNDSLLDKIMPPNAPVKPEGSVPSGEIGTVLNNDQFPAANGSEPPEKKTTLPLKQAQEHVSQCFEFSKEHGFLYCILCCEIYFEPNDLIKHMLSHNNETRRHTSRPERAAAVAASAAASLALDNSGDPIEEDDSSEMRASRKRKRTAPKKSFTCKDCGVAYTTKVYLIRHCNLRHPTSNYCKFCGDRFPSNELLQTHLATHESHERSKGEYSAGKVRGKSIRKAFTCNLCVTTFSRKRDLVQHQQNTHGIFKPMHVCTVCGREFKEKAGLRSHTRVHTGEKPYMCSYCGNSFADQKTWKDHERRHRGEKPFLCTTCGKSFTYRQSFTRHMKFHEGKRPFQCSFCGKAFVLRQNLKEHEKRHNK